MIENPSCTAVSFTKDNTTCKCPTAVNNRRMLSGSTGTVQYSTSNKIVESLFDSLWVQLSILPKPKTNVVVIAAMTSIILIILAGIAGFLFIDIREIRKTSFKKMLDDSKDVRTVGSFFESIFPNEFKSGPWKALYWNWLELHHDYLCLVLPYRHDRTFRVAKWVVVTGRVLSIVFINTIITNKYYSDDGTCESLTDRYTCNNQMSPFKLTHQCDWNKELQWCMYMPPAFTYTNMLVFTIIVCLAATPISYLIEFLTTQITYLVQSRMHYIHSKVLPTDENISGKSAVAAGDVVKRKKDGMDSDADSDASDVDDEAIVDKANDSKSYAGGKSNKHSITTSGSTGTTSKDGFTFDEFVMSQTWRANILRGARLEKAHKSMDFVLPHEEATMVVLQGKADQEKQANHMVFKDGVDNTSYKQLRYGFQKLNKRNIEGRIQASRKTADYIRSEVELLSDNVDKEVYLLKNFFIDNFTGYRRSIVMRWMLGHFQSIKYANERVFVRLFAVLFLPFILLLMVYFIAQFNLTIGSRAGSMWVVVTVLAVVEDALVLQSLQVWIRYVVFTSAVAADLRNMFQYVKLRGRIVLMRTNGLMRDSNALVQHFNPACRAARMFPSLPVSRFLLSLSDFDIPLRKRYSTVGLPVSVIAAFFLCTAYLPYYLQDCVIDLIVIVLINVLFIVLASIASTSLALCIVIVIGIAVSAIGREALVYLLAIRKRQLQEKVLRENMFNDTKSYDVNDPEEVDAGMDVSLEGRNIDHGSHAMGFFEAMKNKLKPSGSSRRKKRYAVSANSVGIDESKAEDTLDDEADELYHNVPTSSTPQEIYHNDSITTTSICGGGSMTLHSYIRNQSHTLSKIEGPPMPSSHSTVAGPAIHGSMYQQQQHHIDFSDTLSQTTNGSLRYRPPPSSLPPLYAVKQSRHPGIVEGDEYNEMNLNSIAGSVNVNVNEQSMLDQQPTAVIRDKTNSRGASRSGRRSARAKKYMTNNNSSADYSSNVRDDYQSAPASVGIGVGVGGSRVQLPRLNEEMLNDKNIRHRRRRNRHSRGSTGNDMGDTYVDADGPGAQSSKAIQPRKVDNIVRNTKYLDIHGELNVPVIDMMHNTSTVTAATASAGAAGPSADHMQSTKYPMWH